VLIPASESLGR